MPSLSSPPPDGRYQSHFTGLDIAGLEADPTLHIHFATATEMSDFRGVVCLITIGNTPASIARIVAFTAFALGDRGSIPPDARALWSAGEVILPGEQAMTPRDAFFAVSRAVPLAEAVGEVAAELAVPYPPGVPVLVPGEVISALKVVYLQEVATSGGFVRGMEDPTLTTIRIVGDSLAPCVAQLVTADLLHLGQNARHAE